MLYLSKQNIFSIKFSITDSFNDDTIDEELPWPIIFPSTEIPSGPYVSPSGFESMTNDDIQSYFVPVPVPISCQDFRLQIQRPQFAQYNTLSDIIDMCSKYNESNAQRVIAANAHKAFKQHPTVVGLDMDRVLYDEQYAQQNGILALLEQAVASRRANMVPPIDPDTMIPYPTPQSKYSNPLIRPKLRCMQ